MKFSNVFRTVTVAAAVALAAQAFAQDITPIDSATPTADGSAVTLNWLGDPGAPNAAYRVYARPSLVDTNTEWEAASGFVTPITSWTLDATVDLPEDVMFFRVEKVDREGPSIEYLSPAKDAVSVPVDAEISVRITDESGVVASNTLAIYVGDVRHAYLDDENVTWDGSILTYSGGNLGNAGDTIDVWATAKDTKGNVTSSEQSLLVLAKEVETVSSTQVVPFLVIGAGEENVTNLIDKVSESPGTAARSIAGIRSAGIDGKLGIVGTTSNTLVFAYTGNAYELLAVEQLWASEVATNIFYRKISAIRERDESASTITVDTTEATLADFFAGGTFTLDSEDEGEFDVYDVEGLAEGENPGPQSRRRLVRPRISGGTEKRFSTNGVIKADWLNDKLSGVPLRFDGNLGEWDVGAGFSVAADFGILKRKFNSCDLAVNGNVHVYLHPKLVATTNAQYNAGWTNTIANVKKTFAGTIGPVPVWVDVGVEVPVILTVQAQATNASVEAKIDISRALDFRWRLTDDQWKQIGSGNTGWVIAQTNFSYEVYGSAGVRASIKPKVTVKVYSLIGAYGWVEPYLEANASGYMRGQNLQAPEFHYLMTAYAGLEAGIGLELAVWNEDWGTLPSKTFSPLRKELLRIEGTNTPPSFASKPFDYEAKDGETVMLSALAKGTPPLRYTWYHNGVDTGRRENYITMTAAAATEGTYMVKVKNGYGEITASAELTLATNTPVVGVVGTWRFLYQWEGDGSCSYAARIYSDGSMHDTSPNDFWWDWHLNGKTIRFETREKWNGASAVYRGARWNDKFMSGTMTSPSGLTGTWSMEWVSSDPEHSVDNLRALRSKAAADNAGAAKLDPAGFPLGVLAEP